ncbi:histone-like nucleoid-structuring protein Lsr2 [Nocardia colli]|uniref:histone-like nucleoid-structuring protein Lsr2 n=1 Tax=Nocardia colli TaxID=2545717 RepID=UPI0035E30E94
MTSVDDYDGRSQAEETVAFGVDGVDYKIALSTVNARQLRQLFEEWTPYARKIGRASCGKSIATRPTVDRDRAAAIREWARERGVQVASRGRISVDVVEAYDKANG